MISTINGLILLALGFGGLFAGRKLALKRYGAVSSREDIDKEALLKYAKSRENVFTGVFCLVLVTNLAVRLKSGFNVMDAFVPGLMFAVVFALCIAGLWYWHTLRLKLRHIA